MDRFRSQIALIGKANLDAVLIGGLAVGIRTTPRATFDVDFAVRASDLAGWKEYLTEAAWRMLAEKEAFTQWLREADQARMDLMLVDDSTFLKIFTQAEVRKVANLDVRVASANTLLAMKLHATHYRKSEKLRTDWMDVIALMEVCGYTVDSIEFKKLYSRYAAPLSYDQFRKRYFESESSGSSS
jgi:predicted nucleotidyltransferase